MKLIDDKQFLVELEKLIGDMIGPESRKYKRMTYADSGNMTIGELAAAKAQLKTDMESQPKELPLLTDDDYDHPNYPNKTRLKYIPGWDNLASYQKNELRLLCEAQRDADMRIINGEKND